MLAKYAKLLHSLYEIGPLSKSELAKHLDVEKNTAGRLVTFLEQNAYIQPIVNRHRNKRYSVNPRYALSLGIEHSFSYIRYVLVDASNKILSKNTVCVELKNSNERLHTINEIIENNLPIQSDQVKTIGISEFVSHHKSGTAALSARLPDWPSVRIDQFIQKKHHISPCFIGNTDAYCLYEKLSSEKKFLNEEYSPASLSFPFIYVQADEGIGLSVMTDRGFFRGDTEIFGELGHVTVQPHGEICICGNQGCLETISGVRSILQKAEKFGLFHEVTDASGKNEKTIKALSRLAHSGNTFAQLLLKEAGSALGQALAATANILGIIHIILGGALMDADEIILPAAAEQIKKNCVKPLNTLVMLQRSSANEYSAATAAAWLALEQHFAQLRLED